jgi:hypothetical protein
MSGATNTSLIEDVLSQVMSYTTSKDVWLALQRNLSSISRAKVVQLRTQLAIAHKRAMTAKDYFLSIKRMADELAFAGQPLKSNEILTYVLAGLGQEYDSLVSTITSRFDVVTLEELYSLLVIAETRINQHYETIQVVESVNMDTRQPPLFQSRPGNIYPSFNRGRGSSYRGKGRGGHSTTRDQGAYNSLICQACLKP